MKGIECSIAENGFYGIYYPGEKPSKHAVISMAGDSCDDHMAVKTVQWLHGLGLNVLAMSPAAGDYSCHDYPLERFGAAIGFLHEHGNEKTGMMGASTTAMLALLAASFFPEITLTIAISPGDFVMEGYYQEKGGERPGDDESTVSWKGEPLPYLPFAYRHPQYWQKIREEARRGRNMIASREMFDLSEKMHPVTDRERIKVENIRGTVMLIGAEDDCLWDTCRYIRRMEDVLKKKAPHTDARILTYEHGTHFLFPQSLLKKLMPIGSGLLVSMAFKAGRNFRKECLASRIDVDDKIKKTISEWMEQEEEETE